MLLCLQVLLITHKWIMLVKALFQTHLGEMTKVFKQTTAEMGFCCLEFPQGSQSHYLQGSQSVGKLFHHILSHITHNIQHIKGLFPVQSVLHTHIPFFPLCTALWYVQCQKPNQFSAVFTVGQLSSNRRSDILFQYSTALFNSPVTCHCKDYEIFHYFFPK